MKVVVYVTLELDSFSVINEKGGLLTLVEADD